MRSDAPAGHRPKAGTPTMGGLLILASVLIPTLLWSDLTSPFIWIAMLSTLGFGAIGFLDDYLKVRRRSNQIRFARYKLTTQNLLGVGVGIALRFLTNHNPPLSNTRLIPPFFPNYVPYLGLLYVPFVVLVLVSMSNTVNLTDGLDGLAISTFTVSAATFTALTYVTGHRVLANYLLIVHFSVGS